MKNKNNTNFKPTVLFTENSINKVVSYRFAKGSNLPICSVDKFNDFSKPIAAYGYKRGTGIAIRKSNDFWYIDHGYFKQSSREFVENKSIIKDFDGYFRIVHNNFWHDGEGSYKDDRLKKLNLNFKEQKRNGEYIIISEPTSDAIEYYDLKNWTQNTINQIQKFTDRKIIVHNRNSKVPLLKLLQNAWAFISDHSSAAFLSIQEGVPAYFTNTTLKKIGSIDQIEKGNINYNILNNLAYGQWNMNEIDSGEAWEFLSKTIYK